MSWYPVTPGEVQVLSDTWRREAQAEPQPAGTRTGEHGPLGEMLAGLVAFAAALGFGYRG